MTFGEKLQELRRKGAMSQDGLAEKLEVSRQAVSKWERDEAMPETDKIVRIAQLFDVSTDYLLLDQPARQTESARHTADAGLSGLGHRVERIVRRHGYKYGYILIGLGSFLCILALLVMLLMPGFGLPMFDMAQPSEPTWNSGIQVEGEIPPGALEELIGQAGSNAGWNPWEDPMEEYRQEVDKMQNAWKQTTGTMSAMFGIPVMLMGIALITLGTVMVIKGKKIAAKAET